MSNIPHYPKVLALGSTGTERVLEGQVLVQEKIDGSQLRVLIDEAGAPRFGSHRTEIYPEACPTMFKAAVEYLTEAIQGARRLLLPGTVLFGEVLAKPKHNTLCYDRVPHGSFMLFDVQNHDGSWWTPGDVCALAVHIRSEVPATFYWDHDVTLDNLKECLTFPSRLGGTLLEGVVIKNYEQRIVVGGHMWPVFAKLVRAEFKETNQKEQKANSRKSQLEVLCERYCTPARWQKAAQHLAEEGTLERSPRAIGALVREVQRDLEEEEREAIKEQLWRIFYGEILRASTRGLPEWWKAQLAEGLAEKEEA